MNWRRIAGSAAAVAGKGRPETSVRTDETGLRRQPTVVPNRGSGFSPSNAERCPRAWRGNRSGFFGRHEAAETHRPLLGRTRHHAGLAFADPGPCGGSRVRGVQLRINPAPETVRCIVSTATG